MDKYQNPERDLSNRRIIITGGVGFILSLCLLCFSLGIFGYALTRDISQSQVVDINSQILADLPIPEGALGRLGQGRALDAKFHPDGERLVIRGILGIFIYSKDSLEIERIIPLQDYGIALALSPDGNTIAAGVDDDILLFDLNSGELIRTMEGHSDTIRSIEYSPDGFRRR